MIMATTNTLNDRPSPSHTNLLNLHHNALRLLSLC